MVSLCQKHHFLFPPSLPRHHLPSVCLCCFASLSTRVDLQSRSSAGDRHGGLLGYELTPTHCTRTHAFWFLDCLMCWNGKSLLSPTEHKPCFIANLYISLSLLRLSLLTPPTLSSVVSYSAHVLISLLHPHILQTLAKLWLHSSTHNLDTHIPYSHSKLNGMKASQNTIQRLIEWPDGANWIVPDVHGPTPLGSFPDRPKASTQLLRAIYITVCTLPITHSGIA